MEYTNEENNSLNEIPKIWKTSISKAELAELPAEEFKGIIKVIDTEEDIDEAVSTLREAVVIGFDTETKPSFRKGERYSVSLLQLSTLTHSFLFRLNHIGLPTPLVKLLEDPFIKKIGLSIHDDFLNLNKKYSINPQGFIELQSYVKDYNISDNSLSRIYGILFGKRISKGQRLSNWEAENLSTHQQQYAALDAVSCLTIYNYLEAGNFNYLQSKYYREFDDPTTQQSQKQ